MNFRWWLCWAGGLAAGFVAGKGDVWSGFWVNVLCGALIVASEIVFEYVAAEKPNSLQ